MGWGQHKSVGHVPAEQVSELAFPKLPVFGIRYDQVWVMEGNSRSFPLQWRSCSFLHALHVIDAFQSHESSLMEWGRNGLDTKVW
jgi:hypothetical protein